jgi:predicted membrane protein
LACLACPGLGFRLFFPSRRLESAFQLITAMQVSMFQQVISFAGALLILIAYVGQQFKWMESRSSAYSLLNIIGSAILGYIALHPFQLGFVLLEFTWTAVSLYGFWHVMRSPRRKSN